MIKPLCRYVLILSLVVSAPLQGDQKSPELDELFIKLKSAINQQQAVSITSRIWQIWRNIDSEDASQVMALGQTSVERGAYRRAIGFFTQAIHLEPDFAEAWNARATTYYYMGEMDLSTADIKVTLKLEPRHFGAILRPRVDFDC